MRYAHAYLYQADHGEGLWKKASETDESVIGDADTKVNVLEDAGQQMGLRLHAPAKVQCRDPWMDEIVPGTDGEDTPSEDDGKLGGVQFLIA